ncbi:MAG: hypothetical protein HYZ59_06770, partial [Actinobacteria bacterium]|nr:hypothetical protein [Actinomycetota bacterium]
MALSSPGVLSPVAADVVRRRLQGQRFDRAGALFRVLLFLAVSVTVLILLVLIGTVLTD